MAKKRRFTLRHRTEDTTAAPVGFQDLPADADGAGVVTHPAPGADEGPRPETAGTATPASPSLPGAAVIVHPPEPRAVELPTDTHDLPEAGEAHWGPPSGEPVAGGDAAEAAVDGPGEEAVEGTPEEVAFVPDVVVDAAAREDVVGMLGASVFVDGPPGSGRTTLVLERIVAAVRQGETALSRTLVLSPSESASQRILLELRGALEHAAEIETDPEARRRLAHALGTIRDAAITTPEGLAAEIVRRWPVEAGIPPGFDVLSPADSRSCFERQWRDWLTAATLAEEAELVACLRRGLSLRQLRRLAESLVLHRGAGTIDADSEPLDVDALVRESATVIADLSALAESADPEDDGAVQIRNLAEWVAGCAGLRDDALVGHFLQNAPAKVRRTGSRAHWEPPETCARQMELCKGLDTRWSAARTSLGRQTLAKATELLDDFVDTSARERRRLGTLLPVDVVIDARDLLSSDGRVLAAEQSRVDTVCVDDVWNFDAACLDLVGLLASEGGSAGTPGRGRLLATGTSSAAPADMRAGDELRSGLMGADRVLEVVFGTSPRLLAWLNTAFAALFAGAADSQPAFLHSVAAPEPDLQAGEPDPEPWQDNGTDGAEEPSPWAPPGDDLDDAGIDEAPVQPAQDAQDSPPEDPHEALSTSEIPLLRPGGRSSGQAVRVLTPEGHEMTVPAAEIIDRTPTPATAAATDAALDAVGAGTRAAATAVPGAVGRPPDEWPPLDDWKSVLALTVPARSDDMADIAAAEAHGAAAAVARIVDSGEPIVSEMGEMRPARFEDCAVVALGTAGLHVYEQALVDAGIPVRTPRRRDGLERPEVDDLLAVLDAADDPSDTAAVVAALRGLASGCSDDALVEACASGPGLDPLGDLADVPEPVRGALACLASLHEHRHEPAPDFLERVLTETGIEAVAASLPGGDSLAASLRHLHTLAAAVCGSTAAPVGRLREWIAHRRQPMGRDIAPLASAGTSGVLVATVAEAREARFPVVILVGTAPPRTFMPSAIEDVAARRLHLRVGRPELRISTAGFEAALAPFEERRGAARVRAAYLAASRARDLLVVPLAYTSQEPDPSAVAESDLRRRLAAHLVVTTAGVPEPAPWVTLAHMGAGPQAPLPWEPEPSSDLDLDAAEALLQTWRTERAALLDAVEVDPAAVRAARAAPDPVVEAVRAALGRIDLSDPEGDPSAIAAACAEAAVPAEASAKVAELVAGARGTQLLRRAAAATKLLRRPTALLDGGNAGTFRTRLDLAFVEDEALVAVVVEAGQVGGSEDAQTRLSLAAHALSVATGLPVGEAVVLDLARGDTTSLGPADVAAHTGAVLGPQLRTDEEPAGSGLSETEVLDVTELPGEPPDV